MCYTNEQQQILNYSHNLQSLWVKGWNGLRYFLYEYEMEKVRQRGSQKIDWKLFVKSEKDKVSIEHI
ncbi:hypothetical protein EZS27_044381, partial [termite gut metagenome]